MRVFCCDDDSEILRLVEAFFTMQGHEVCLSDTTFGLSKKITQFKPDVLLLDHRIPGLTGENFLNVFQHQAIARTLPVIYYSAEDREKMTAAMAKSGVRGWIPKSVVGLELVRQVEALVEEASLMGA
jgi:DNA-binding response OmpR family regulator